MKVSKRVRRLLLSAALAVVVFVVLWFTVLTTAASRSAAAAVASLHHLIAPASASQARMLAGTVTFERVEGLPDVLEGRSAQVAYRFPDRLVVSAEVDGNDYAIGRNGQEVWMHVPHKQMALIGADDVPRFASDPTSVQPIHLAPFRIPGKAWHRWLLPAALEASFPSGDGGAGADAGVRFRLKPWARRMLDAPDVEFELTSEPGSGAPRRLEVRDDGGLDLALAIDGWSVGDGGGGSWDCPTASGDRIERVALSHLKRFVEVTIANLGSRIEPLGPPDGTRTVVARSGMGRLERIDGVRVLFLKGSPEELGRQHGELLRDEIRSVVDRILYGVGVGSSFDKGRWFFGEIEEAVARLEPHIDTRYLREMDAIAAGAGLDANEVRLANFFPELFHCSGFALHGTATADGSLYHGRVLDYLRGVGLEENAVVMVVDPEIGNAWVNVSYAGFVGSITAMNEKQVAIGEMGGRGEGLWDGKPMAQLMREVMERADTIDEAVEIMRAGPRTCEYYYVISDAKDHRAVGIAATPDTFETVWSGETHPRLPHAVEDAVLLSAGDRYEELVRRVKEQHGSFTADSARDLMTRPVCMDSNIQSVLFAPDTLDFWVGNADSENVASHTQYRKFNLRALLGAEPAVAAAAGE